jgi:hypothetical protein
MATACRELEFIDRHEEMILARVGKSRAQGIFSVCSIGRMCTPTAQRGVIDQISGATVQE